ncbi:N-acyl-D-glucosamine 2-epimerase [Paenibacillus sp. sptzw28]|uniref:N-acyl-D-glucosamine 2-epimerase n=1 Tax=Paenibacillus sp. sptzw28 TaxID=715179 RepID=UPI0021622C68|nr:N-acyl-D-glucosamine 2-epimerase [Paenibacillus sp. sptzw28]
MKRNKAALYGPTIQIDPGFLYYRNRSPESIADEILQNGYTSVRYFVVNENIVDRALIDAFHERGVAVWATVLGNGSYSVEQFPAEWPGWQMKLLKPVNDGYYRFSPFSKGYRTWKKQALVRLVMEYPFDGIEVAEPYLPEWDGIDSGVYGDVGPLAQEAFLQATGRLMPNFTDPAASDYYLKNPELYEQWVDFRVQAVNGFLAELINGYGGVRDSRKDILVATWSLAVDAGLDSVHRLREYQGLDAARMISAVDPDLHILQTHWPDWMKPQGVLPGSYIRNYQNFIDQIRSVHPDLPLGVQADIGSRLSMVKDRSWLRQFHRTAQEMGFSTWTAYEYHLGSYMYTEAPFPTAIQRPDKESAIISFQKRIDPASAHLPNSFIVLTDGQRFALPSEAVTVDGNRVLIRSSQLPNKEFQIHIANVTDTPQYWLYNKTQPANVVGGSTHVHRRSKS